MKTRSSVRSVFSVKSHINCRNWSVSSSLVCLLSLNWLFCLLFLTIPGSFWIFPIPLFYELSCSYVQSSFLEQLFGFAATQLGMLLFFVPSIVCCFGKQSLRCFRLFFFLYSLLFLSIDCKLLVQIKSFGNQGPKRSRNHHYVNWLILASEK